MKTNGFGNVLWGKALGANGNNSVRQTSDGGFITCGSTLNDIFLFKTDANGNIVWKKYFDAGSYEAGNSVIQTTDGGYIITENTGTGSLGVGDIFLIKTDLNGNIVWSKKYVSNSNDKGKTVLQTNDGGYLIGGEYLRNGSPDMWIIKTDNAGTVQWSKTYTAPNGNMPISAICKTSGGYYIAGDTYDTLSNAANSYLLKINNSGNVVWSKKYNVTGQANNYGYNIKSLDKTNDDGYVVCGAIPSTSSLQDYNTYLLKTDSMGISQWSKCYKVGRPAANCDWGYSVISASDGGYMIGVTSNPCLIQWSQIVLIKTNANGSTGCKDSSLVTVDGNIISSAVTKTPIVSSVSFLTYINATSFDITNSDTTYCFTSSINETFFFEILISISPNPFTSQTTIFFSEESRMNGTGNHVIIITDVLGNIVNSEKATGKSVILDMSGFAKGIYFVQVTDEKKNVINKKIVVQ